MQRASCFRSDLDHTRSSVTLLNRASTHFAGNIHMTQFYTQLSPLRLVISKTKFRLSHGKLARLYKISNKSDSLKIKSSFLSPF